MNDKELLLEAITMLEKVRDRLTLRDSKRLSDGEITAFIKKVRGEVR